MRRAFAAVISLFAMFAWSLDVQAETKQGSAEELLFLDIPMVVTASKKAESIDEAPNTVYVITAEEIKERGYKDLRDVFRVIPGFAVFHKDLQDVGQVRGIAANDNEKFMLMINGKGVNQITEPDFFNGGSVIMLDNVERVEVIVGPGSVLYGGETLVATINMITKEINGNEAVISAGNFNSQNGTVMVGQESDDKTKGVFASLTYRKEDGYNPASNGGGNWNVAPGQTGFTDQLGKVYPSTNLLMTAHYNDWSAQVSYQNSEQVELTILGRRYDYIDSNVIRNKKQWTDSLSTTFEFFADLKRTLRVNINDTFASGASGSPTNYDLSGTDYGAEYAVQHKTDNNYFQAGVQYQILQNRHNYDFNWAPENPFAAGSSIMQLVEVEDTESKGLYLSDDYKVNDKLKLTGAVRFDANTILGSETIYTSPRAAIVYSPSKAWTSKLMYNKATRLNATPQGSNLAEIWGLNNPNVNVPFTWNPATQTGTGMWWAMFNTNITKPEVLQTVEYENIFYVANTRVTISLYKQMLNDFATWFGPRTNVGNFDGKGVELTLDNRLTKDLRIWANGSHSENTFELTANPVSYYPNGIPTNTPGGELDGVPEYTANFGIDWKIVKDVTFCPSVYYFTRQASPLSPGNFVDDQYYANASLLWENSFCKGLDLRLSGNNLGNNNDMVATQWSGSTYQLRGPYGELTAFYKF